MLTQMAGSLAMTSAKVAGSVGLAVLGYKAGRAIYHSEALESKIADKLLNRGYSVDKAYGVAGEDQKSRLLF